MNSKDNSSGVRPTDSIKWQKFTVSYEYPVAFTRGLFHEKNHLLADAICRNQRGRIHRCLIVADSGAGEALPQLEAQVERYFAAHHQHIKLAVPIIWVPGGEQSKYDLGCAGKIMDSVHTLGIDRHSYIIAIGGGAVLDMVGLVAATAHRGIRHVRIPTTVLSQNDSGVGVKNAVNLNGIKNYLGTFAPPWAVLNDFDFLDMLPRRDRISGIAEAVKVALIRDGSFYRWIEEHADELTSFQREAEEHMIRRSAELHMDQIAFGGDPFESGSARPLDFGHWSAHKLEALTAHELRHGEAVAIGIALDTCYSALIGLITNEQAERVLALLLKLEMCIWHPVLEKCMQSDQPEILQGLRDFQEHLGGELSVTMLKDFGHGLEINEMDPDLVSKAISWVRAYSERQ